MKEQERIKKVNTILEDYFNNQNNPQKVQAKEMMPLFIQKGIFNSNQRDGLPIRNLLRKLDSEGRLKEIPYVHPERKGRNTNWYFVKIMGKSVDEFSEIVVGKNQIVERKSMRRDNSDEYYVINLCDEVLGKKALRQHRFDFLVGDAGTKLPVDAYYEDLKLVVEYCESQHTEKTPFFDKRQTVSGVNRGVQRKLYDLRRKEELPKHGIRVIEIHYSDFGESKRLKRNAVEDIIVVKKKLADFL